MDDSLVTIRIQQPSTALRPYVENLWYHEGLVTAWAMERLLPDGAIELIIDLTDPVKRWATGENWSRVRTVKQSWISGQHSGPIAIESAKNSCMIGARFRPGGAFPFFPFPIADLNDSVTEMDLLWGRAAHELRERLLAAPTVDDRFQVLDETLVRRALGRLDGDRTLPYALHQLTSRSDQISIRFLAQKIGISQKRLIQLFEQRVGLKPKRLARILRFQRVLKHMERDARLSWSALAAEYGYFDQAHFVKDFSLLSGLRPTEYLRDRGEHFNFIPILS